MAAPLHVGFAHGWHELHQSWPFHANAAPASTAEKCHAQRVLMRGKREAGGQRMTVDRHALPSCLSLPPLLRWCDQRKVTHHVSFPDYLSYCSALQPTIMVKGGNFFVSLCSLYRIAYKYGMYLRTVSTLLRTEKTCKRRHSLSWKRLKMLKG